MVTASIKIPVNLEMVRDQSYDGLIDILHNTDNRPGLVFRKDTVIKKQKFPAGAIVRLSRVFNNYNLPYIAEELDAIPIWPQKSKSEVSEEDELNFKVGENPYFNIADAIKTIFINSKDKYVRNAIEKATESLDAIKQYLVRCTVSSKGFYINGVIRELQNWSKEEWYRASAKEFPDKFQGESYFFEVQVDLNIDNGLDKMEVSKTLSTTMYLRENMGFYREEMVPIIRAGIEHARKHKLPVITKLEDVEDIIQNKKGLEIMSNYEQRNQPLKQTIEEFTSIMTPLYKFLMDAKDSVRESEKKIATDIANKYIRVQERKKSE